MFQYMKQLLIEIDDETATRLEGIAPSRSRRRSDFVRSAIRRALWELEEHATAEAYSRTPDSAADVYLDARVWEGVIRGRRGRRGR
jgi:predicted transcriptional regulator